MYCGMVLSNVESRDSGTDRVTFQFRIEMFAVNKCVQEQFASWFEYSYCIDLFESPGEKSN